MFVISYKRNSQTSHLYFRAWSFFKGNKRTHKLASKANVQAGAVMDRSDIPNAMREIGRSSDSVQHGVSETVDRLQDLHIQRGISKCEHLAEVK
jgi:hypothetical protein